MWLRLTSSFLFQDYGEILEMEELGLGLGLGLGFRFHGKLESKILREIPSWRVKESRGTLGEWAKEWGSFVYIAFLVAGEVAGSKVARRRRLPSDQLDAGHPVHPPIGMATLPPTDLGFQTPDLRFQKPPRTLEGSGKILEASRIFRNLGIFGRF